MSYTTKRQPQGKPRNLANFLREAMIGELVAINDYQEHISSCSISEVKEVFEHIMKEEKKHYGMLLNLSRNVDHIQHEAAIEAPKDVNIKGKTLNSSSNKKKNTNSSLLKKIRDDIKGELEAIIAYEDIVSKITDQKAIKMITEIASDEKKHVEELTYLLQKLDGDCYGPIEKDSHK
ncbi:MAG: ferritin family protein [Sarcina sp.]